MTTQPEAERREIEQLREQLQEHGQRLDRITSELKNMGRKLAELLSRPNVAITVSGVQESVARRLRQNHDW
jgi:predicted TIM-barrel fold metal-dependent hydrolase